MQIGYVIPAKIDSDNRYNLLEKTMKNLMRQEVPNGSDITFLVVDDSSQMPPNLLVDRYNQNAPSGIRFEYLHREKPTDEVPTASGALNDGMQHLIDAGMQALSYVHSDDQLFPYATVKRVEALEGVVFGGTLVFTERGPVRTNRLQESCESEEIFRLTIKDHITPHGEMWTKEAYEASTAKMREHAQHAGVDPAVIGDGLFPLMSWCEDTTAWYMSIITSQETGTPIRFIGGTDGLSYAYRIHKDTISGQQKDRLAWCGRTMYEICFATEDLKTFHHDSIEEVKTERPWTRLPTGIKNALRPLYRKYMEHKDQPPPTQFLEL